MLKEPALETEAYNNHVAFSQTLLADQYTCTRYPEHALINWIHGDPPPPMFSTESSTGDGAGTSMSYQHQQQQQLQQQLQSQHNFTPPPSQ
jgi:hypothetical protein